MNAARYIQRWREGGENKREKVGGRSGGGVGGVRCVTTLSFSRCPKVRISNGSLIDVSI